jgi:hypothetical protein
VKKYLCIIIGLILCSCMSHEGIPFMNIRIWEDYVNEKVSKDKHHNDSLKVVKDRLQIAN